jgi:hypothetical protein
LYGYSLLLYHTAWLTNAAIFDAASLEHHTNFFTCIKNKKLTISSALHLVAESFRSATEKQETIGEECPSYPIISCLFLFIDFEYKGVN